MNTYVREHTAPCSIHVEVNEQGIDQMNQTINKLCVGRYQGQYI